MLHRISPWKILRCFLFLFSVFGPLTSASGHSPNTSLPEANYFTELSLHKHRMLYSCYTGCETCFGPNENNCLTCVSGYYLDPMTYQCVNTCPTGSTANYVDATCDYTCAFPLGTSPEGDCVFCGPYCLECASAGGQCLTCHSGFENSDGICTQSSQISVSTLSLGYSGFLTAYPLNRYSTQQNITVYFQDKVFSTSDISSTSLTWVLFASDILPDFGALSCAQLTELFTANTSVVNKLSAATIQYGQEGSFEISTETNSSMLSFQITQLRSNTNYNFTLCMSSGSQDISSSITFTTRDNGNRIKVLALLLSETLATEEIQPFLCELTTAAGVEPSYVRPLIGKMCQTENERLLEGMDLPVIRLLEANGSQLQLLLYGNATTEDYDQSADQIASIFASPGLASSFSYSSFSGSTIIITGTNSGGYIDPTPPIFTAIAGNYERTNSSLYVTNLTLSGADGYIYLYMVREDDGLNITDPAFPAALLTDFSSVAKSKNQIFYRKSFSTGQTLTIGIPNVPTDVYYQVLIFATNEDASEYAVRATTTYFIANGTVARRVSGKLQVIMVSVAEGLAVVSVVVAWVIMFKSNACQKKNKKTLQSRKLSSDLPVDKEDAAIKVLKMQPSSPTNLVFLPKNENGKVLGNDTSRRMNLELSGHHLKPDTERYANVETPRIPQKSEKKIREKLDAQLSQA